MDEPGNGREPGDRTGPFGAEPDRGEDPGCETGRDDETGRDSVDRLIALIGPRIDEMRSLLGDSTSRWRGDALRVGEGTRQRLRDVFRELGVVTRDDWDELELRVAQLEHRLRLLERREDERS
jgi:polyhydroxyalkanoate synthesis regulator phasin